MNTTKGEVILGIGGGIAAYKSADLLRRLQDSGYQITVVPTPSSLNFVGAATWEALSGRTVTTQVWERVDEVRHIQLAKLANFILIAPATADLIARLASGRADDLLTNVVLASTAPVLVVPAMHPAMWTNSATIDNVKTLRSRGIQVMEPETGRLTGSDSGQGRFPQTQAIIERFESIAHVKAELAGRKIVVTAGGTREAIDPVRFIGNKSSGKQGIAIAKAAARRGAEVHLIAANVAHLDLPGVTVSYVETADQMLRELQRVFEQADVLVMSAAVADAKPKSSSLQKIKKALFTSIELEANPDLIATLAKDKGKRVIVGFAAETSDLLESAKAKLTSKGMNIIYVNDVSDGAIFGADETEGTVLLSNGEIIPFARESKDTLAGLLLDLAIKELS